MTSQAEKTVKAIAPSGLMTTEQAAEYLVLKPSTLCVWRTTNRKRLPFYKIGGRVVYKRSDLDAFIEANARCVA